MFFPMEVKELHGWVMWTALLGHLLFAVGCRLQGTIWKLLFIKSSMLLRSQLFIHRSQLVGGAACTSTRPVGNPAGIKNVPASDGTCSA